jgi:hypothetical protein
MKIKQLITKLVEAGLISPDPQMAWEAFSEAVLALDLQGQADFSNPESELFEAQVALLWSELGGEGSPLGDRPSVAIARSSTEPRRVSSPLDEPADNFLIPHDVELAIRGRAQHLADEVCKVYRAHAVNAARQGIADINAQIMDLLA